MEIFSTCTYRISSKIDRCTMHDVRIMIVHKAKMPHYVSSRHDFDKKNDDFTHESEKIRQISAAPRPIFVTNFHVAKAAGPLLLPHW